MRAALVSALLLIVALSVWLLATIGQEPTSVAREADAVSLPDAAPAVLPEPVASRERQLAPAIDGPAANVRVVGFGSGLGVAGVTVRYRAAEQDSSMRPRAVIREDAARGPDLEAALTRYGGETVTDAEGRCYVAADQSGTPVCARLGELYAQGHLRQDAEEPLVLRLRPDRLLRVLVVDSAGQPVANIRIVAERNAEPPAAGTTPVARWSLGTTDAEGRCVQPHCQIYARDEAACLVDLQAIFPGGTSPGVRVDFTAPPAQAVLQLPAAGGVAVHVRDAEGQPIDPGYLGDPEVQLAAFARKPTNRQEELDGFNGPSASSATIDERGDAAFPCVAFDHHLVVQRRLSGVRLGCAGPTADNPFVEVTLQEGADQAIVTGVLLRPGGAPFTEGKYRVKYRAGRAMGGLTGRTDEQGRLRCNLGSHVKGREAVLTFDAELQAEGGDDAMAIELPPRSLEAGINDLGELRLQPLAILVAGRLVCDEGVDVKQVSLDIRRSVEGRWVQEWNLRPEWKPDGSFTVRSGIAAGQPLRLVVSEGPYLPVAPIECKSGDTSVEIHLRAAGEATATFLVDEHTPLDRLTVRLRRTQPPQKLSAHQRMIERFAGSRLLAKDGRVTRRWTGLEPGTYQLTATCHGVGEAFLSVDGIRIHGGPCTDPRLTDIDLRGRVRTLEIRATGPGGAPVEDANAFVVIKSKSDAWSGYSLRSGVARVAMTTALDLWVVSPSYRMAVAESVTESCTIPLEPAQKVQISVALPSPLPDGVEVHLHLLPQLGLSRSASIAFGAGSGISRSTMLRDFLLEKVLLGPDGSGVAMVRWPGAHAVEGTVSRGGRGGSYFRDIEPRKFSLPRTSGVKLRVGRDDFDEALQRLR